MVNQLHDNNILYLLNISQVLGQTIELLPQASEEFNHLQRLQAVTQFCKSTQVTEYHCNFLVLLYKLGSCCIMWIEETAELKVLRNVSR